MDNIQGTQYGKMSPSAFSSNKGEDFRAVLETVISVKRAEHLDAFT